jgi:hypothetical protein
MQAAIPLPDPMVEAVDALRALEMSPDEARIVTTSDDPEIVRRHLELHRERLEESFDRQRLELRALAVALIDRAALRRDRHAVRSR